MAEDLDYLSLLWRMILKPQECSEISIDTRIPEVKHFLASFFGMSREWACCVMALGSSHGCISSDEHPVSVLLSPSACPLSHASHLQELLHTPVHRDLQLWQSALTSFFESWCQTQILINLSCYMNFFSIYKYLILVLL